MEPTGIGAGSVKNSDKPVTVPGGLGVILKKKAIKNTRRGIRGGGTVESWGAGGARKRFKGKRLKEGI